MKNKKDVLFLCQFFFPEYVSSALLPFQTALKLKESGLSVDVLCGYPKEYSVEKGKLKKKEMIDGIFVERLRYLQLSRKGFVSRLTNYLSFTMSVFFRVFKLKKYRTIVVYSNPPILPIIAVLAKNLFGCKIIFVSYDIYPEIAVQTKVLGENSLISKVMSKINGSVFKNVSLVVALSKDMKKFLLENRKIDSDKIDVIPNWATEEGDESGELKGQFKNLQEESELIISYFGNMGTAQDIETIKATMAHEQIKDKKITFLFAGHGNKKDELKDFIQSKKLENCHVFDYLQGQEFADALGISDLFIVSLDKNVSGLAVPSKTYSYYKAGRPVIAIMDTETDISKEIRAFDAGIAVGNNDVSVLVDEILQIYVNKERLLVMNSNVKKLYEEYYTREQLTNEYVNAVNKVLGE